MRIWVRFLASLSGLRIQSCGEPWCGPAAAVLTRPLAWELPYATSVALERPKKKKKNHHKLFRDVLEAELVAVVVKSSRVEGRDETNRNLQLTHIRSGQESLVQRVSAVRRVI